MYVHGTQCSGGCLSGVDADNDVGDDHGLMEWIVASIFAWALWRGA